VRSLVVITYHDGMQMVSLVDALVERAVLAGRGRRVPQQARAVYQLAADHRSR